MGFRQTSQHRFGRGSYHQIGLVRGQFGNVPIGVGDALILGFLLSMAAVLGDLFESLLKRASGAKDSGSMVPGMGGVLDLLDSLLFGAPVLYYYARLALV